MTTMNKPGTIRIAYFIGTLRKEDGVAQVLLALAREAKKKGFPCVIVTGWVEDMSVVPVPVITIPSVVFPLYRDYRLPLPGMRGFEKELDDFRPDIIHVHSPDTSAWAAIAYAKKTGIPVITTHHTDFARYLSYYHIGFAEPFLWFLLHEVYDRSDRVTTPSPATTNDLLEHGVKNVITIGWGVDTARFDPSFRSEEWRKSVLPSGAPFVILCVCRLTWEKDLKTLAATYTLLRQRSRNPFAMVIAGDGPARGEIEKMMPGAIFLGHIEKTDLSRVYASSDILLFPSSTETFGNVTAEAMVSGAVPVVANAGGSQSLVQDGKNGFLAAPRDAEDFYQKTSRLMDNPQLLDKIKKEALKLRDQVSWEHVFSRFIDEYSALLKSNGSDHSA
jgi:glycosyltransferase involved in cell wall biosynthesis